MSVILGLNAGHPDAAACLVVDGVIIAAIAEERLGLRYKYDPSFPINAINFVLNASGYSIADVTDIAVARKTTANLFPKIKYVLSRPSLITDILHRNMKRNNNFETELRNVFKTNKLDEQSLPPIFAVEHHTAHIASAYYTNNVEEAVGISYDGSGDFVSVMVAKCIGKEIRPIDKLCLPHSLGHFYSAICQFIGFDNYGEEYKVMGLAPYGSPTYLDELSKVLDVGSEVELPKLNLDYVDVHTALRNSSLVAGSNLKLGTLYTPKLIDLLGKPRARTEAITQKQKDIARSAQAIFESAASNIIKKALVLEPSENLVLAGGCALNGVMNAKIHRDFYPLKMHQHSASGDDGTALGAALYCFNKKYAKYKSGYLKAPYLGGSFSDTEIENLLKQEQIPYKYYQDENVLLSYVAQKIVDGGVVGWFQGRSEWGPRALGNRSILASPLLPDMKETINEKIKKRESFRPFAPSVLEQDAHLYFEQDVKSPYMMHVVKFREKYRSMFPSVTHIDGTGRIQTVNKDFNPRYFNLIQEVKLRSGHGMLLNTSFNENEPVVETPLQAISVFNRTTIDLLVLQNCVVERNAY